MPTKKVLTEEQKARQKDRQKAYGKKYREENKEKRRAYYLANSEKYKANRKRWVKENPEKRTEHQRIYRANFSPEKKQKEKEDSRRYYYNSLRRKYGDEYAEKRLQLWEERKAKKDIELKKVAPKNPPERIPVNAFVQRFRNLKETAPKPTVYSIQQNINNARKALNDSKPIIPPVPEKPEPRPTGFRDETDDMIYEGDLIGGWDLVDGEMILDAIPVLWWEENQIFAVDMSYKKDGSFLEPLYDNYHGKIILGTREKNPHLLYPNPPQKRPNPYK